MRECCHVEMSGWTGKKELINVGLITIHLIQNAENFKFLHLSESLE